MLIQRSDSLDQPVNVVRAAIGLQSFAELLNRRANERLFQELPQFPAVKSRVIQMTLQHLRDQRLFLRDRFIHNDGSFLLCDIPKDALDNFVLYGENINFLVRGWKTWCIRAASDNLHDVIAIIDNPARLQIITLQRYLI